MAEKELILREKMDHSGLFNFSDIYTYLYRYLVEEGNFIVKEEKYSEKVSGAAREITVEWVASKPLGDYYAIEFKIKFELTGVTDVDAEIDGKKQKMNKGKIAVDLKGFLIIDPLSKWDPTPTLKFLREVYNKYIIPQRNKDTKMLVVLAVTGFKENLKSILELTGKR